MRKVGDPDSHRTLAGGLGTQLRPMMFWPRVFRYVDVTAGGGMDLGVINVRSKSRAGSMATSPRPAGPGGV